MSLVKFFPESNQIARRNAYGSNYADLFNNIFNEDLINSSCNSPKVNVKEESEFYELQLAVPGLRKEDIHIDVNADILKVSHEFSEEKTEEKAEEEFSRKEFSFADFERSFHLPDSIDHDKIEANLDNGILRVLLHKKEESKDKGPKEISIS